MLGTRSQAAERMARELFDQTNIVIESTSDVRGAALCGVLKNIYACGFGMIDRKWGWNMKGWYVSRALVEMADITAILGGRRETAQGTAGVGDFIATCFSKYSSNVRAGRLISMRKKSGPEEGVVSIRPLLKKLGSRKNRFPLVLTIAEMVRHNA